MRNLHMTATGIISSLLFAIYVPLGAAPNIVGATVTKTASNYDVGTKGANAPVAAVPPVSAPQAPNVPNLSWLWWLLAIAILGGVLALLMRNRMSPQMPMTASAVPPRPGTTRGTVPGTVGGLVPLLLSLLPNMTQMQRSGLVDTVLGALKRRGIDETALQTSAADLASARTGATPAVSNFIKKAADVSPQGLREGVASFANSSPEFFKNLPPNISSQLGTLLQI
jgi:hypothetical protein